MTSEKKSYVKEAVLFSVVCICTAVFIFLLYHFYLRGDDKISAEIYETTTKNSSQESACTGIEFLGDGYCDDDFNTAECNFDLGDCCDPQADRSLCQDCFCNTTLPYKDKCDFLPNCPRQWELGNGKCEEDKNVKECFFDLGDCCLDDSTICIKSSIYCIEAEFGDGICQDHNNSPFCDFDGGDCCLGDLSQCCECNCSNPIPGGHPVVG